ncbi:hypothetical protein D9M70_392190 [compost metagenome]
MALGRYVIGPGGRRYRRRGEEIEQVRLGVEGRTPLEMRAGRHIGGRRLRRRGDVRRSGLPAHEGVEAGEGVGRCPARSHSLELHQDLVFAQAQHFAVLQRLAVAAMHAQPGIHQQHAIGAGIGQVVGPVAELDGAVPARHQPLRIGQHPVVFRAPPYPQLALIERHLRTLSRCEFVITGNSQTQRH